jgi:hypothetical protein
VYVFHESFNGGFRDFHANEFVNEVYVYGYSNSGRNGDEGGCLPSSVLYGVN